MHLYEFYICIYVYIRLCVMPMSCLRAKHSPPIGYHVKILYFDWLPETLSTNQIFEGIRNTFMAIICEIFIKKYVCACLHTIPMSCLSLRVHSAHLLVSTANGRPQNLQFFERKRVLFSHDVYMEIYAHIPYACMFVNTQKMHVHTYTQIYTRIHTHTHTHICTHIHTYITARTNEQVRTHAYTHIHRCS